MSLDVTSYEPCTEYNYMEQVVLLMLRQRERSRRQWRVNVNTTNKHKWTTNEQT